MKCYNCGNELSSNDFCTACGADVTKYKKILHLSNAYYNDGLERAKVRDLSGAVVSLRQSLKCNKNNIEARNLLGLVYYELGDPVLALGQWVISKNFRPKKNIADDFMHAIQSNPGKLDQLNQVIRKYNQSLFYCEQESYDMAIIQLKKLLSINPRYIKALLLLALLYIHTEEYNRALKLTNRVLKIDINNTQALLYQSEISKATASADEIKRQKKTADDTIVYRSGNETIIQPIPQKPRTGLRMILSAIGGLLVGILIMWVIVLPARIKLAQNDLNKQLLDVSGELTEKSATLEEMQMRVDALKSENAELLENSGINASESELANATEQLINATNAYLQDPDKILDIADSLAKIDEKFKLPENSSDAFRNLYGTLSAEVGTKASETYLERGLSDMESESYSSAIENLSKAWELNNKNSEALINLAHAYRRSDNDTKAEEMYRKVIKNFPDTEYAEQAAEYVTGDVPIEAPENNNTPQNQPAEDAEATEVTNTGITVITPDMVAGDDNQ